MILALVVEPELVGFTDYLNHNIRIIVAILALDQIASRIDSESGFRSQI